MGWRRKAAAGWEAPRPTTMVDHAVSPFDAAAMDAERARVEKEHADAEALAKAEADKIVGRRVSRSSVVERLRVSARYAHVGNCGKHFVRDDPIDASDYARHRSASITVEHAH